MLEGLSQQRYPVTTSQRIAIVTMLHNGGLEMLPSTAKIIRLANAQEGSSRRPSLSATWAVRVKQTRSTPPCRSQKRIQKHTIRPLSLSSTPLILSYSSSVV